MDPEEIIVYTYRLLLQLSAKVDAIITQNNATSTTINMIGTSIVGVDNKVKDTSTTIDGVQSDVSDIVDKLVIGTTENTTTNVGEEYGPNDPTAEGGYRRRTQKVREKKQKGAHK